jgi:hypothetical protein
VLFVGTAAYGGTPLPLSYVDRLKSLPAVQAVTYVDTLVGTYQQLTQVATAFAIDPIDLA